MKKEKQLLGYYNGTAQPISLHINGTQVGFEPNQPVCNGSGFLVKEHPDLEAAVNSGLLRRIHEDHPDYADWDNKVARRKQLSTVNASSKKSPVADVRGKREPQTETHVSSSKGLMVQELPEGATQVIEGTKTLLEYKGKKFPSLAALEVYLKDEENSQK